MQVQSYPTNASSYSSHFLIYVLTPSHLSPHKKKKNLLQIEIKVIGHAYMQLQCYDTCTPFEPYYYDWSQLTGSLFSCFLTQR